MEYRVERLAAACGVSVDTIRYYQSKGLLPPPLRRGRVAIYDGSHAARVERIRALQRRGLPLSLIGRVLAGEVAPAEAGLAAAVAAADDDERDEPRLTLEELADRTSVPVALLRSIEKEGMPLGRRSGGVRRYSAADVELVRRALTLLEAGIPFSDLLGLARDYHTFARATAERAVALFDAHVRKPLRAQRISEDEAAERLVTTFRELLPAVTDLVAHHFRRTVLDVAAERLDIAAADGARAPSRSRKPRAPVKRARAGAKP